MLKQKTDYQLQVDQLTAACATVQGELDQTKADLNKSNHNLQQTTGELEDAKADMSAKQAELEKLNQEMETAKKDLETNQKALEKAKKGVEQLKNLIRCLPTMTGNRTSCMKFW